MECDRAEPSSLSWHNVFITSGLCTDGHQPTSLRVPLFFYCSAFLSSVNARLPTAQALAIQHFFFTFPPTDFWFISPSVYPSPSSSSIFLCSVRVLLHHLSLVYLPSYFLLSFCFALRCCHRSALTGLAALVLFVHLLHNFVGPDHSSCL